MQQSVPKASRSGLTKLQKKEGWTAKEICLTDDKNKVSELPRCPNCPSLIALYLQGNYELIAIPPRFFQRMALLQVLDLSCTSIKSLPKSLPKLVALKKLLLRCCDLFMELSPQVGKLKNLEELNLDETQIMDLPRETGKLIKLRQLKVSFYHLCGKKKSKPNILIHPGTISNLLQLAELSIDVNPADKRWDDCVEAVVKELCNSKTLRTLCLYLPEFQLLGNTSCIYPSLSRFRFTVGHHKRRIISRVPHEVEVQFRNWDKCLKFVNGENIPIEIKGVLKYSTSFFLDHHATAVNLSEFGIENMKGLKFCLLVDCNEMETLIDGDMIYERNEDDRYASDPGSVDRVFESLECLSIYYMENLQSIWRGPNGVGCMTKLKFLALHACPRLSKIFSHTLLENFVNLEEIILEDCPKVTSLVCHSSVKPVMSDKIFLPNLKRLLLLYLPALVSICSGLLIAPKLERIGCYNCPKLTSVSKMELSSKTLKIIKGERQWWENMNWNETGWGSRPDYLMHIFSPIDNEKDVMTQLVDDRDILEETIQNEGQQLGIPEASIQFESQQSAGAAEPQTSVLEITMSELKKSIPLSHTGTWSGDSDCGFKELDPFNLDASKKRKTLPRYTHHVRVRAETDLSPEDGFFWRKYGIKEILGAKYPRIYYRCTNFAQGCLAKKQEQRTNDDPRIVEITYLEMHTCKQVEGTSIEPQKLMHNNCRRDAREPYKLHSQPFNVHRVNEVEDAAEAAKTISSKKGYGDVFEASIQDKEANPEFGNQPDYLNRIFSPVNKEKDVMTQLAEDRGLVKTTIENEDQQSDNEKYEMTQFAKDKDLLETPIENEGQQQEYAGIDEVPMVDESQQSDVEVRRGPWTPEENFILISYIAKHGVGCWNHLARASGLKRTGKSCRLRWMNYLRPDIRRGNITLEEELLIMEQHAKWGLPDQDYRILPPPPPAAALPLPSCAAVQAPSMPTSSEFASDSGDLGSGGAGEQLARTLKRPQLVWTPQLHKRFVDVVAHLGIKNAVPQTIMQLMSVDGLTRENVASHLQKYRLYLKRMQCLSGGAGGRSNGGAGSAATTDPACEQMVAAAVGHPDLQAQYHRQLGHFGSSPNGQFEHPLLARQTQQPLHRMGGAPLPKQVPSSHVQDLESANGNGGRKVLTLFPSGDY